MKMIVRGDGIYLYDSDGKEYIDGSGGAIVINAGHGVAEIAEAVGEQARRIAYVNGMHFTNEPVEALAQELADLMPEGLGTLYFLSSGSAATEAAIKLARQYWYVLGHREKYRVISRIPGYHGNTLAALSISGRPAARTIFEPLLLDFDFIDAPIAYRCPDGISYEEYGAQCAAQLEEVIIRVGPETVAAFMGETVVGASAVATPPRGYFKVIREICDRYDVLFIDDEVLSGMGRTGSWLAIEQEGVIPDVITLGKGLSGGYAPLSALAVSDKIVATIAEKSGSFSYNQTFSHYPLACAAALATIRYLKKHDLVSRCAEMGEYLLDRLNSLREIEIVGDVRGRGLLAGVELVADRSTKTPFPAAERIAERIWREALEGGLVTWYNGGFLKSGDGDLIILGPPFVITRNQIDELVRRLDAAIRRVSDSIGA